MTKQLNLVRIAVILLFALTFTLTGWFAPMVYASHAPPSHIMEVDEFAAQDTSVHSSEHYICFDRTVHRGASGRVFTELYLIGDDGKPVEVDTNTFRDYFREGDELVLTTFDLPNDLKAGEYRYLLVIQMDLAGGRVTRNFEYESNTFEITEERQNSTGPISC